MTSFDHLWATEIVSKGAKGSPANRDFLAVAIMNPYSLLLQLIYNIFTNFVPSPN